MNHKRTERVYRELGLSLRLRRRKKRPSHLRVLMPPAEKIFLRDWKIGYCAGCGVCVSKGSCLQKDDMAEILQKMIAAAAIVMATPVYFYTMNGQMKTLIDRTCPGYAKIRNKRFFFVITAADTRKKALERTLEGFRGFTSCLSGAEEAEVVCGTGAWKAGEIKGSKAMTLAYELARGR